MPAIVGAKGAEGRMPISLSQEEQEKLLESAKILKNTIKETE
jgi:malate/lactate dehydrogenase